MKAVEVAEKARDAILSGKFDLKAILHSTLLAARGEHMDTVKLLLKADLMSQEGQGFMSQEGEYVRAGTRRDGRSMY